MQPITALVRIAASRTPRSASPPCRCFLGVYPDKPDMYVYIYIHTNTYIYIHVYIYTHIYIYIYLYYTCYIDIYVYRYPGVGAVSYERGTPVYAVALYMHVLTKGGTYAVYIVHELLGVRGWVLPFIKAVLQSTCNHRVSEYSIRVCVRGSFVSTQFRKLKFQSHVLF